MSMADMKGQVQIPGTVVVLDGDLDLLQAAAACWMATCLADPDSDSHRDEELQAALERTRQQLQQARMKADIERELARRRNEGV